MRQFFPFVVLLTGGLAFTACSKKAETTPAAASSPSEATTTSETVVTTPPASEDAGISFNIGSGTPGSSGAAGAGSSPAPVGGQGGYAHPRRLNEVYAFYPLSLRMKAIEGRVDVKIGISADGRVESAEIHRATEERFNAYALAAAKTARFIPALQDGKPVASNAILSIPFVSELGSGSLSSDSVLARLAYLDGVYYTKDSTGKMVPAEIKEPIRLSIVTAYPASAKAGEVLKAKVRVTINDEGQVTSATVSDATTPEFAAALKDVTQFWHFIPKMKAGKPVTSGAIEFPLVYSVPGAPAQQ